MRQRNFPVRNVVDGKHHRSNPFGRKQCPRPNRRPRTDGVRVRLCDQRSLGRTDDRRYRAATSIDSSRVSLRPRNDQDHPVRGVEQRLPKRHSRTRRASVGSSFFVAPKPVTITTWNYQSVAIAFVRAKSSLWSTARGSSPANIPFCASLSFLWQFLDGAWPAKQVGRKKRKKTQKDHRPSVGVVAHVGTRQSNLR